MLIHHFLEKSAARFPDKVALIHEQTRATYGQINKDADNLSLYFKKKGIAKGDRVVILLTNGYEYVVTYYAILKAGAVAVPLSTDLKPDGLKHLLSQIESVAIVSASRFERLLRASDTTHSCLKMMIIHAPKLHWGDHPILVISFQQATTAQLSSSPPKKINAIVHESKDDTLDPSDLATIIYTSGSTGEPRGVMLSHRNIVTNTMAICDYFHLGSSDIHMVVLPFFYVMGKSLLNTHFAVGGTLVVNNRFAYPATVLKQMVEEQVTGFSGVPSTYAYLLHRSPLTQYKSGLDALRFCAQAGGHLAQILKIRLREALPDHTKIYIMYGATEAAARLTMLDPQRFEKKIDSIGKPLSGVDITIRDEDGHIVRPGQTGELYASGPNIMMGYWKDEETSRQVLGPNGYRTGDQGHVDDDGFIYLMGRKDNMIKVGGHRVNTQEVEDLLLSTNLIVETAVFGVKDDLLGNRLKALIVTQNSNTDASTVVKACSRTMPRFKIPSDFIPVKAIPKKANGKTDRSKCLSLIGAGGNPCAE